MLRLRSGLNPHTWVPEASMLTTRPPKPSFIGINITEKVPFMYTMSFQHE